MSEVSRGHAQLALWSALFEPEAFLKEGWHETSAKMKKLFPDELDSSFHYLRRTRFLAGYRLLLQEEPAFLPAEFGTWSLPEKPSWLRATALKYRGAMYAAAGKCDEARQDFNEAVELLEAATEPLMRFIQATIAWEAARSLAGSAKEATCYQKRARELFSRPEVEKLVSGPCAATNWLLSMDGRGSLAVAMKFPY